MVISTAQLLPISGVDGYIAMCLGTPTAKTGETFAPLPKAPGGSRPYTNQLYSVVDRGKKIADSRIPPKVYVDAQLQAPTSYRWFPGGAYVLFFVPVVATPGAVTVDFTFIPTSTVTGEVYGLLHVNNWQLNLASNPIPGPEYGTLMDPQYRGKQAGTWQFERYSSASAVDLYMMMMTGSFFVFSLYESLIEQRQWIVYGDIGANPMAAPTAGMVGGTMTGTLVAQPSLILEPLAAPFTP